MVMGPKRTWRAKQNYLGSNLQGFSIQERTRDNWSGCSPVMWVTAWFAGPWSWKWVLRTYPGPGLGLRPHRGAGSSGAAFAAPRWAPSGPATGPGRRFQPGSASRRLPRFPDLAQSPGQQQRPRTQPPARSPLPELRPWTFPQAPRPQAEDLPGCVYAPASVLGARARAPSSESPHRCNCPPHSPAAGLDAPAL